MLHKIQDGDTYKLIPQISPDGKISWIKEIDCLFLESEVIFDVDKKWANKLRSVIYKDKYNVNSPLHNKINYAKRYFVNFIDKTGNIKTFQFGKKLHEIITENADKLTNIRSNWQLHIVMEIRNTYPVYDKTHIVEKDWFCPVVDLNDQQEWVKFIKTNSPDLDTYFRQKDIKYHRDKLSKIFGNDIISEIISTERNEKLNQLGI
jgi:hypothetical protein